MARNTGAPHGTLTGLLRPTVSLGESDDAPPAEASADSESRGESNAEAGTAKSKTRRKRPAPAGKTRSRNYYVNDDIHFRIEQTAIDRKMTNSDVVNDYLNRSLPRYEVTKVAS